jgi:hypothetical protein
MKGNGERSMRKREQAIAALLTEPTLAAAANRSGVGETTLWRWLQDPGFQNAYASARRSVVDAAIANLQQAATEAVACLRRNLNCGQVGAEVRAAGVILDHVLGVLDRLDFEERLRRLEALPEVRNGQKHT